jgi:hypothetical protein
LASLRDGDAHTIVIPAKAGIQYAAAYRFNHGCLQIVIASEAKQSIHPRAELWIASQRSQ